MSSVNISQVFDPRSSVQNTLMDPVTGNVNYVINRVSKNVQFYSQAADTTSFSNIKFSNVNNDPSVGISSTLIVTVPVSLKLVAAPGSVGNLIVPGAGAPRSSFFMKNNAGIILTLNSQNFTEAPYFYMHAAAHYGYNYETIANNYSYTMKNILDNNWSYNVGDNNCVLNQYQDTSLVCGIPARGAYEGITWSVRPGAVDPTQEVIVDILFTEAVPISPLNFSDYPKYCLPGVSTFGLQLTYTPLIKNLWSYSRDTGAIIDETASQVYIGNDPNCVYGNQAYMWYQTFDIPRELTLGRNPSELNYVYPYYSTQSFQTFFSPMANGASQQLQTNTITPQGVPSRIYLFAEMNDNERTASDPYWFLAPELINITFLNKQQVLASVTIVPGQTFNTQLYTLIAAKNGCKDSLPQWMRTPVICLTPEDLNLDSNLITGQQQQSSLQAKYTVKNISGKNLLQQVMLTMTIVYEGAITYTPTSAGSGGVFTPVANIANAEMLKNANILSSRYYYLDQLNRDYFGGLSMKQLLDSAKNIGSKVVKGIETAAPYVKSAAKFAAPLALAALGAGNGGGFVGGQQVDRRMLRNRLQ